MMLNFSNFIDANMLMDISDYDGLEMIKENYLAINKDLEFVPQEGIYAVPYAANAAGILYNKDMFEENGWEIPTTWNEFISLCETIEESGKHPLYFGFKDTWTTLAPWNALAVGTCDSDLAYQVTMPVQHLLEVNLQCILLAVMRYLRLNRLIRI